MSKQNSIARQTSINDDRTRDCEDLLEHLFNIKYQLGEGAYAKVYKAWDKNLKKLVALKVHNPLHKIPKYCFYFYIYPFHTQSLKNLLDH